MRVLPRRAGATTFTTLGAFVGAFILIQFLDPQWARAAGLDVWKLDDAVEHLRREEDRQKDLAEEQDHMYRQIGACDPVAAALIEDRIEFCAAVNEIEEITRDLAGFDGTLALMYSECKTHRERVARYTISKVRSKLSTQPAKQAEVTARLEAAYRGSIVNH